MMEKVKIIAGLLPEELEQEIVRLGQPAYRSRQIGGWVFAKNAVSFSEMSDMPAALRQSLPELMQPLSLTQKAKFTSPADATVKYVFQTGDNEALESVFIPAEKRATVCVSTQIGCAFGCVFCASGANGLVRNLRPDEIVSQVLRIRNDNPQKPITNVVIMGIGEPLANYENTLKAVRIINHPGAFGLAARKITISTCGLPEQIMRLAEEGLQFELSISLHAADNRIRSELMPVNEKYPIETLIEAAKEYTRLTRRMITFECVLIGGVNAGREDAEKLAAVLSGWQCKVNLIPFNAVPGGKFLAPQRGELDAFCAVLDKKRINYTVRRSRGVDIKGACGQLRAQFDG